MSRVTLALVHPKRLVREGLKHLLVKSRFSVVAYGSSFADAFTGVADGVRIDAVLCALVDETDAGTQIAELAEHRAARAASKFVVLTDIPKRDVFYQLVEAGVDAVLSKDISAEVLQRSLQLVMLGQQFFPSPVADRGAADRSVADRGATDRSMADRTVADRVIEDAAKAVIKVPGPSQASLASPSVVSLDEHRPLPKRLAPVAVSQHRKILLSERESQILACLVNGASNKLIARELQIAEATVKVHVKGLLRKVRVNNRTQAAIWALNNADTVGHLTDLGAGPAISDAVARQASG